jgi:3-oxoacyl-[acyl-carrier protein] reductase
MAEVALITGAGQGIGFAIAEKLAQKGIAVLLNDSDETLAYQAVEHIQSVGGICQAMVGDASDIDFVRDMVAQAVHHFGKLTIAIANAGATVFGSFWDYQPDDLKRVMQLNLAGSFFLTQAAAQQMREQAIGGRILLMSSVTGVQAHQHLEAYGMTKAGLQMLAKQLVIELSPHHITINCLAPGATATERTLGDTSYENTWSRITPLGKPASVSDIAAAAAFLVSPEACHITGQTLIIDGGWTSVSPSPF